jgi:hypothetical protein
MSAWAGGAEEETWQGGSSPPLSSEPNSPRTGRADARVYTLRLLTHPHVHVGMHYRHIHTQGVVGSPSHSFLPGNPWILSPCVPAHPRVHTHLYIPVPAHPHWLPAIHMGNHMGQDASTCTHAHIHPSGACVSACVDTARAGHGSTAWVAAGWASSVPNTVAPTW